MKYLLFSIILIAHISFASPAAITNLQVHPLAGKTQIIFILDKPIKYHIFSLQNPRRLAVDLKNIKPNTKINTAPVNNNILRDIRGSMHKDGTLRVVVDLKQPVKYHSYMQRNKLFIDIRVSERRGEVTSPLRDSRPVIIVIDPGHGGRDPGATGQYGTHEKDVVLAISKDLQNLINKQPGFKAELTRNGDYFIPLRRRLYIERHDHADMFIAIHADGYKDHYAEGASVFALSQRGATSEAARWLAQKENESELGHVLANKSDTLKSVLIDLAQTASITTSLAIGNSIVHELSRVANLHRGFVEQAAFVVLKEPDVPSLLVETGFISNAREELSLRRPQYQQKIAHALMLGIVDYFNQHRRA